MNQKIKNFIDEQRPITQMPGYGMIDLTKYIPTDDEIYINMLEYMSYWSSYWMIDYMPKNKFCELVELYLRNWHTNVQVRQYKHILVENTKKYSNKSLDYQSRNMTDKDVLNNPNYWYQGVLSWCKNNPEGMRILRELKLERILK
jgi:hypothetical protein